MGTLRRIAGTVIIALFVLRYALRPLLGNPALSGVGPADLLQWPEVVLYLPLLALAGVLLVLAVLAVVRGDGLPAGSSQENRTSWSVEPATTGEREHSVDKRYQDHPAVSATDSEETPRRIETEQPDAALGAHLDHLERELGDDEHFRADLTTLADVVEEAEDGPEIPRNCPTCNAPWTERTLLDIKNGRYDELDNGQLICLDCEAVHDRSDS